MTLLQLILSDSVQTKGLQTQSPFPVVQSATTEQLQSQRQSTSVMMAFTRMVQQQECARVMVYGMAVYLSAYQIKEGKMVNIFCISSLSSGRDKLYSRFPFVYVAVPGWKSSIILSHILNALLC